MNVFVTSLLKIINNPDIQDTNYNIAYYLLLHYYDVFEMTLQENCRCMLCFCFYSQSLF